MNSNKLKPFNFIAIAGLVLAMAVPAWSNPSKDGQSESCSVECYLGSCADGLDLSEDQKAQMQARVDAFRESTKTIREQLKALCEEKAE